MDKENTNNQNIKTYDKRLTGTFITVIAIGAFILASWLGVFYFYISTL